MRRLVRPMHQIIQESHFRGKAKHLLRASLSISLHGHLLRQRYHEVQVFDILQRYPVRFFPSF